MLKAYNDETTYRFTKAVPFRSAFTGMYAHRTLRFWLRSDTTADGAFALFFRDSDAARVRRR